jgi:formylglycine-generating enzyme required for sulfatase activity
VKHRHDISLVLESLNWVPADLCQCARIKTPTGRTFLLGKHLVSNEQYKRFIDDKEYFNDDSLWCRRYRTSLRGLPDDLEGDIWTWLKTNLGDQRLPKYWNDPTFGIRHRNLPVVGVSWYEANAYCHWLLARWSSDLDEAKAIDMRPRRIRLPTEGEWVEAVVNGDAGKRFAWSGAVMPTDTTAVSRCANVGKVLDSTSILGMFPMGKSDPWMLNDWCGNVWEWQANWFDHSRRRMAIRGGAFTTAIEDASTHLRGWREPDGRDKDLGFRILIECE